MILPVSLMRIRVVEGGRKKVNLWLPILLVWPLVLALMVALAPVVLVLCIVWPKGRPFVLAGPRILGACWSLRGFQIRVRDGGDQVDISFV